MQLGCSLYCGAGPIQIAQPESRAPPCLATKVYSLRQQAFADISWSVSGCGYFDSDLPDLNLDSTLVSDLAANSPVHTHPISIDSHLG